ncbi:hypothetical protein D3C73_493270 [compost metagenome]|uniref:DUF2157 domain-containing protein n=1 Tax=Paenibacillus jilunlii TaxID=682956 RepID=A0A1G9MNJ0_9BACL|nr:hypothetical protein [Paenibacillus jilunlii]KWX70410.1 hypothetical protein AML91_25260 [Paenibacillus jilunlii]SDL75842.1 hypothetical protein SAMN05216191_105231 [Paenibacillus jilunlii]
MNLEKREIILREIQYWRRSKVLPEQYCDFLSNLYDDEAGVKDSNPISLRNLQQGSIKIWLFGFGIISLIFLISLYFSVFPWPLQLATALCVLIVCYGYSYIYRDRNNMISLVLAGAGSVLTLGFGLWLIALHDLDPDFWRPLLIAGCGLLWVVLGFFLRISLLHFCGFAFWALLYAGFFGQQRPDASILELELLYLPLCVLMVWLSWLLHHRVNGVSGVYLGVGVSLWIMPEIDALLLRQDFPQWVSLILILKIAAGLALLFIFRKKWITWVTS